MNTPISPDQSIARRNTVISTSAPSDVSLSDPTDYLKEKSLDFNQLSILAGLFIAKDHWYGQCLQYPLININGELCGYERIFPRGKLHERCPEKFSPKDNKKVTKGTRVSEGFALIGKSLAELPGYFGCLRVVGGLADAVSVYLATNEPVICIVGEHNARSIATQVIEHWPHLQTQLIVALDHDLPGIAACHRSGCSWLVPEHFGEDWSEVRQQQGICGLRKQLKQAPKQPLAPVNLHECHPDKALMTRLYRQNFKEALSALKTTCECCPEKVVSMAVMILTRFHRLTPSRMTEDKLISDLWFTCRFHIHPDTVKALEQRLQWLCQQSRNIIQSNDRFSNTLKKKLGKHYHRLSGDISPRTVEINPGQLIFIKAGHGTGKTKTARALVHALWQVPDSRVLSIGANCSLTQETAESFGLDHYQDIVPETACLVNKLATTVHSLNKPQVYPVHHHKNGALKPFNALILDELTQILASFQQGTIDNPEKVLFTLQELIEQTVLSGGVVLCMDADLCSRQVLLFREWFPELVDQMEVYDKPFDDEGIEAWLGTGIKARNAAVHEMQCALSLGRTITVVSDSRKQVENLYQLIQTLHPDSDVCPLQIHANNSGQPEQKAFLEKPEESALKYSVVLYSPAIVGGLSVTSVAPDHTYVFSHNVLTAPQIMQQMRRYRKTRCFTVIGDIVPAHRDCEDFINRLNCLASMTLASMTLASMTNEDNTQSGHLTDYDGFVEMERAHHAKIGELGANGLWYCLEERRIHVHPLSERLDINSDVPETNDILHFIEQEKRQQLPNRIINAGIIQNEAQFQQMDGHSGKTEEELLSCQRYRICSELGIDPRKLDRDACDFWLNTGLKKLRRFSITPDNQHQSYPATQDSGDIPMCHRNYEMLEQKFLHYLLEPLKNDDGKWLESWSKNEAGHVVDQMMQIEKEHPWAQKRLGLMPGSMIQGKGKNQTVVRPKSAVRYVKFLLDQLGLKTKSRQVRINGGREWHYQIDAASLIRMAQYADLRAQSQGVYKVSRIRRNSIRSTVSRQTPETFSKWCKRCWLEPTSTISLHSSTVVDAFFCQEREGLVHCVATVT